MPVEGTGEVLRMAKLKVEMRHAEDHKKLLHDMSVREVAIYGDDELIYMTEMLGYPDELEIVILSSPVATRVGCRFPLKMMPATTLVTEVDQATLTVIR
jgi:hypothetical protein